MLVNCRFRVGLLLIYLVNGFCLAEIPITLPENELHVVAGKVFHNECGSRYECLTSWNKGEHFASLGIGHFIWYPDGVSQPFQESFPGFLAFLKKKKVKMPDWLEKLPGGYLPWPDRASFLVNKQSTRMEHLRQFLHNTMHWQTAYMANRLYTSLDKILVHSSPRIHDYIRETWQSMIQQADGLYALLDYVNFKGEGILKSERYSGQGWGLLQVLEEMERSTACRQLVNCFAAAAEQRLRLRVKNSPRWKNEKRWLKGWLARINTYRVYESHIEKPGSL